MNYHMRFKMSRLIKGSTMSEDKDFKDPFNLMYFLAFLAIFVGVGCLNAILGWMTTLS